MSNGYNITPDQFRSLPQKQKLDSIYNNIYENTQRFASHEKSDTKHFWAIYGFMSLILAMVGGEKLLPYIKSIIP